MGKMFLAGWPLIIMGLVADMASVYFQSKANFLNDNGARFDMEFLVAVKTELQAA